MWLMPKTLKVGIIGVNAKTGWAREAHVTVVQALEGLELAAVATRDQASADEAAKAFGASQGYGDALELINDANIDIVTVAAPVPAHRELIQAAIAAGKHVVTEWPVTPSTAETRELASAASAAGIHTAVDLEASMSLAVIRAAEIVRSGNLGRILSATAYSTTAGFGRDVPFAGLYLEKPESAMNLVTIQTAHTLDFIVRVLGPLESLAALTTIQYPTVTVDGGPATRQRVLPDHVLVQARAASGAAISAQVVGGAPADDTPFRLDVRGDRGALAIEGGAPRGFQAGPLRLSLNGTPVDLVDPETVDLPASTVNVGQVYAALRGDIRHGTRNAPSLNRALRLAHLVDALQDSAASGSTVTPSAGVEWPA
jgi:predicted dehydrogenase